jgi:fructose 1,6-bisphosphatase
VGLVAICFQVAGGKISSDDEENPIIADLFDAPAFALAWREAMQNTCTLRNIGEFEPARLSSKDIEYTTIQKVLGLPGKRFKPLKQAALE